MRIHPWIGPDHLSLEFDGPFHLVPGAEFQNLGEPRDLLHGGDTVGSADGVVLVGLGESTVVARLRDGLAQDLGIEGAAACEAQAALGQHTDTGSGGSGRGERLDLSVVHLHRRGRAT